jgi:hypothetical protein
MRWSVYCVSYPDFLWFKFSLLTLDGGDIESANVSMMSIVPNTEYKGEMTRCG